MNTIESILSQLTSNALVADVKTVLREQDPEFPPVETSFQEAARVLASRIGKEEVGKLLAAKEQQILSDLVYAACLGFQANLSNFHNPVASQFTKLDYDVFLREHIMWALPHRAAAENAIAAFRETYKDALSEYEDAICTSFPFHDRITEIRIGVESYGAGTLSQSDYCPLLE